MRGRTIKITLPGPEHKLRGGQIIYNVHAPENCVGPYCPIHNPSPHHMVKWHQHYSKKTKRMYRVCPHDILHIDPDTRYYDPNRCDDDFLTEYHDACCISPWELIIVDLANVSRSAADGN